MGSGYDRRTNASRERAVADQRTADTVFLTANAPHRWWNWKVAAVAAVSMWTLAVGAGVLVSVF